ncbi:hypothetical protein MMPV_003018 [Pyropia vietnamensis]
MQGYSGGGGGGGSGGGGGVVANAGESVFVTSGGNAGGPAANGISATVAAAEAAAAEAAAAAVAGSSSSSSEDEEVVVLSMARRTATERLPRHPLLPPAPPPVSPAVAVAVAAAAARGARRGGGGPSAAGAPRRAIKRHLEDGSGAWGQAAPAAAAGVAGASRVDAKAVASVKPMVIMAGGAQPLVAGMVPGAGAAAARALSPQPVPSLPPRPSPSPSPSPLPWSVGSSPPPLRPLQPLQLLQPLHPLQLPVQSPPRPLVATRSAAAAPPAAAGTQLLATAAEQPPAAGVPPHRPATAERLVAESTDTADAPLPPSTSRQLRTSPATPPSAPRASRFEASSSLPWEPGGAPADRPARSMSAAPEPPKSTPGEASAPMRHARDEGVPHSLSSLAASSAAAVTAAVAAAKGAEDATDAAATAAKGAADAAAVAAASPVTPAASPAAVLASTASPSLRPSSPLAAHGRHHATAGARCKRTGAAAAAETPVEAMPRPPKGVRPATADATAADTAAPVAAAEPLDGPSHASSRDATNLLLAAAAAAESTAIAAGTPTALAPASRAGASAPVAEATAPEVRTPGLSATPTVAAEGPTAASAARPGPDGFSLVASAAADAPASAATPTPATTPSPALASLPAMAPAVATVAPPSADAAPLATPPRPATPPSRARADDMATLTALCTQMRSIMERLDGRGRGRRRRGHRGSGDPDGGGASTGAAMSPAVGPAGTADRAATPPAGGATSDLTGGSGGVRRRPRRSSSSASPVSCLLDDQDDGVLSDPTDGPTGEARGTPHPPFVTPTRPAGRPVVAAYRSTPATVATRSATVATTAAASAAPTPASVALPPPLTPLSPALTPLQSLVGVTPRRPPEATAGSGPPQSPPPYSRPPPPPPLPLPDVDIPSYVATAALAFGRAVGLTTHPASWGSGLGSVGSVGGGSGGSSHGLGAGTWPLLASSPLPAGFPYVGLRSTFTYLPDQSAEAPPPLPPRASAAVRTSAASAAGGAAAVGGGRHPPPSTAVSPQRRSRQVMTATASLCVGIGGGDNDVQAKELSKDAPMTGRRRKRQRLATGAAVTSLSSAPGSASPSSASSSASPSSASYGPQPVVRGTPSRGRSSPLPTSADKRALHGGRRSAPGRGRQARGGTRGERSRRRGLVGSGDPKKAPPLSATDTTDAAVAAASTIFGDAPSFSSPAAAARAAAAAAMADGGAGNSGGLWAAAEGPLPPPPSRSAAAATTATAAVAATPAMATATTAATSTVSIDNDGEAVAASRSRLPAGGVADVAAAVAAAAAVVGGDSGGGGDGTPVAGTANQLDANADTDVDADNSDASADTRDRGAPPSASRPCRFARHCAPPPCIGPGPLGVATAAAAWARGVAYVARGAHDDAGADVAVDCFLAAARLSAAAVAALAVGRAHGNRGSLDDAAVLAAASVLGDDGGPPLPPPRTPSETVPAAAVLMAVPALRRLAAAKVPLAVVLVEELHSAGLLTSSTGPSLVALAAAADAVVDPPWPVAPVPDPPLPPSPTGDTSSSDEDEDDGGAPSNAAARAAAAISDAAAGGPVARTRRLRSMARAGARLRRRVGSVLSAAANPPVRRPGAELAVALWSAALKVVPAKSAAALSAHWGLGTASLFGVGTAYAKATARSHFAAALRSMPDGPAVSRWRSAFVKDLSAATRKNRSDLVATGASKVLEHERTTLADGLRAVRLLEAAAEAAPTAADILITLAFVAETPPACIAGAVSDSDAAIDRPRTARYTRRAAALGSTAGINNMGTCYQGGFGVAGGPDLPLATALFARAAKAGHAIAWRNLGLLCEESTNPLGLPLAVASRVMFRCYVSGGGVSALLADWPAAAAIAAGTSYSRPADGSDGGDSVDVDKSDEEATDTTAVVAAWSGILPSRSVDVKASDVDAECIAFAAQAAELGTGVPRCASLARRLYGRAVEVATAVATRSGRAGNHDAATVANDVMALCRNKLAGELVEDEEGDDTRGGRCCELSVAAEAYMKREVAASAAGVT